MTDIIRKDVKDRLENGDYSCSKELTLSMFSGKWKIVVLFHLGTDGPYRFNELMRLLPRVTHKVLTNQLREMVEDGLISREVITDSRVKVTYRITDRGRSLMPILNQMYEWGEKRIKELQIKPKFNVNPVEEIKGDELR
ncbi:winged helix-turn-helix transcriptional regulator [Lentilactobacillus kisonensis]|uniref:HTH-type transcriptional activator HxlR n=1 Tax=Lentilactobacillus kisonensis DSM 19906 = JCM 15041 TaxID=1423766 RepID=A0A0R1NJT0_9LACO|nr:helix-turn-helix domain-containing protein [Lentilactobacillus kisonensis]KRL20089.1 HTH-type transcriptional activator HxlR [Lentilactobacillus kisonensis DSM 19906 = JCM 15041]